VPNFDRLVTLLPLDSVISQNTPNFGPIFEF